MAKANNLHDFLVDLANAIRTKKKYPESQKINPQDFSDEIDGISGENKLAQLLNKTIAEVTEEDFGGATKIESYTFRGCTNLESISVPESVATIGSYAFAECPNITSIEIKNKNASVATYMFQKCSSLEDIFIPYVNNNIGIQFGTASFDKSVAVRQYNGQSYTTYYIPLSLKKLTIAKGDVAYGAFYGCNMITEVNLLDGVTGIGKSAFYGCKNITSITIPNSVSSVGLGAFNGCENLKSVVIPEGVTELPIQTFYSCNKIELISVPNSLEKVGDGVFSNIPDSTYNKYNGGKYIGNSENPYLIFVEGTPTSGINEQTRFLQNYAYDRNESVLSITIPSGVVRVPNRFTYECKNLETITFEGTPTSIDPEAFARGYVFSNITDIYVPWAQGAVSGAPWGATNATIHYNWTPPVPGSDYTGTYEGDGSYSMRYFKVYDANDSLISSGDVSWSGTVTVPQGGRLVVSAQETYGGIYVKVNNLVNCTASEVNSWAETITITPTADNFSFHCEDDFD